MATILELMNIIADDIQHTFEELIKLILHKTIKPFINPIHPNSRIIYNPITGRNERGYLGASADVNVNQYIYQLTNECLGWVGNYVANFKANSKYIKASFPQRFPAPNNRNRYLTKTRVAYNINNHSIIDGVPIPVGKNEQVMSSFHNFISSLNERNMVSIISNRRSYDTYFCDISYSDCYRELEHIGRDIIDQTDPLIPPPISARMSTAIFRVKLYDLEQNLTNLSALYPDIYNAYIELIKIINSQPRSNIKWVIELIATLTYRRWFDIPENQKITFIEILGEEFIRGINANELATILLQSGLPEILIRTCYMYSLLKMLFIVFGYNKLIPKIVTDPIIIDNGIEIETIQEVDNCIVECDTDCEPVNKCIYDIIKLFNDLYPTIGELMGGSDTFPPECHEIKCDEIPPNYDCLVTIPEYLWRFNDYSYCQHLDYVNSKIVRNSLHSKITNTVRYLNNF
uniref:Uncharacterized protein n=1 Tax=viral metagenome TaxID=1070528 RepID=A0A6C0LR47_9ZZZZ